VAGRGAAQYRSAIFFHTPEQEAIARASEEKEQKKHKNPHRHGDNPRPRILSGGGVSPAVLREERADPVLRLAYWRISLQVGLFLSC
jgi:hypothetical protein